MERKLERKRARLRTSSWPASPAFAYACAMFVLGGIMRFTEVMTIANRITNLGSYSGPTLSDAISARHLRVTLRKSGASRNYNNEVVSNET